MRTFTELSGLQFTHGSGIVQDPQSAKDFDFDSAACDICTGHAASECKSCKRIICDDCTHDPKTPTATCDECKEAEMLQRDPKEIMHRALGHIADTPAYSRTQYAHIWRMTYDFLEYGIWTWEAAA